MQATRRAFLQSSLGSAALISAPAFLFNLSRYATAAAVEGKLKGDNVLVIVQLTGGNDGLNTVIPFGDDAYARNRFTLRIPENQVRKIDDHIGLHPAMEGFSKLLEDGKLAIVQGVGYPNPNRSHFTSMDIWHTGRPDVAEDQNPGRRTGWIGRYLDAALKHSGGDVPALHLGPERQPLAVVGQDVRVPSVQSLEGFKLDTGGDAKLAGAIDEAAAAPRPSGSASSSTLLDFMQRSTVAALRSSKQVQDAMRQYQTPVNYPGTGLAQKLRTIAQLIDAGLSTRVYYVSIDGFDTHANQAQAHAGLLRELSGAVTAFIEDLAHHGHDQRVMVMSFSEFGRRIKENASRGTDHGVAAPMFLAGGKVSPGLIGKHPSLTDTDSGDLKFHTDFRQVYAGVLDHWLGFDSATVLGGAFEPVQVLRA